MVPHLKEHDSAMAPGRANRDIGPGPAGPDPGRGLDAVSDSAGGRLADRIVQSGAFCAAGPGTVVASEPELMARYEAGRPVFRQAVRILEERGVAYMRRGPGGGLVVAEPNADFAGRALSIIIESLTEDLEGLTLLPTAIDNHLFLYSARRLDPLRCEALQRLARRLDRLSDKEFLRVGAHRQLHQAIHAVAGEPGVDLAHRTSTEYGIDLVPYSLNVVAEASKGESWRLTRMMADAVVAGDAGVMFECRRRSREMLQASLPAWSAIDRDPGLAPKVGDPDRPEFQDPGHGAERLAREILREIRQKGWKAGERIGGGAELMERYGASVNILRQAVRMLQEHSAVESERGRRGGLFVAVPDRSRAVERAKAFLRQSGAAPADIQALTAQMTLQVLEGPGASLGEALERTLPGGPTVSFRGLVAALSTAARNPILDLFVEIFLPFFPDERGPGTASDSVLAAFQSGDRARARRAFLAALDQASAGGPPGARG